MVWWLMSVDMFFIGEIIGKYGIVGYDIED